MEPGYDIYENKAGISAHEADALIDNFIIKDSKKIIADANARMEGKSRLADDSKSDTNRVDIVKNDDDRIHVLSNGRDVGATIDYGGEKKEFYPQKIISIGIPKENEFASGGGKKIKIEGIGEFEGMNLKIKFEITISKEDILDGNGRLKNILQRIRTDVVGIEKYKEQMPVENKLLRR